MRTPIGERSWATGSQHMLILYNSPSSSERKPVLPMSLLALGALLEERHDYLIIDGNLEPDPVESIDRAIRETGADILAVTVMPKPAAQPCGSPVPTSQSTAP